MKFFTLIALVGLAQSLSLNQLMANPDQDADRDADAAANAPAAPKEAEKPAEVDAANAKPKGESEGPAEEAPKAEPLPTKDVDNRSPS